MKHGKQARQWLVAAVTLTTLGVTTQGFAADAPTTVSEQHMPYTEPAIATEVAPGARDLLAAQGLIDNPALTVGQTTETSNVQALYVAKADQAAIDAQVGKTVTKVALAGVPDGVAQQILPRLITKVGDKVSSAAIAADIKAIGDSGIFAQIAPVFTAVPEGVQLTYQVATNPVVNQVRVEGVSAFDAEYLAQMLAIPQGSVLNTVEVGEKVRAIEDLYVKQGYILASVSDVQVAPDGTLTVKVDEGIVEDIVIKGNKKTKDYVITRELRFKEGDPFNKYLAQRSLERLYNLGYFEDVNVRLLPGKVDHQVVVEIDVLEQKTGVVTLGAGYSKSDGFVGIVEFGENNFRGTGDKINVHWEFGGKGSDKNYQISYTRPWLDDKGTSLGFSFYNRVVEYDDYNEDGSTVATYDKRRKGYNLTLGRAHGEYRTTSLTWESRDDKYDEYKGGFNYGENAVIPLVGLQRTEKGELKLDANGKPIPELKFALNAPQPTLLDEAAQAKLLGSVTLPKAPKLTGDDKADAEALNQWRDALRTAVATVTPQGYYNFKDMDYIGKNFGKTNSLSLTHVFDNRDNYFNPTRGYRYSVTGQWAGHGLGGDFDFYKVNAEGRFYKKLKNNHVLALRVMGGYANGEIGYSELFSLGGAYNLRGFEDDQFKGSNMYAATLEYRFPIIKKVDGVVFTDVGNAWGIDESRIPWYHDSNKVHWSTGVGLRVQTPIGPIRLDYAHGDKNKFHFSFGGQF